LHVRIEEALAQNTLPHHAGGAKQQNIHGVNAREEGYHGRLHAAQALSPARRHPDYWNCLTAGRHRGYSLEGQKRRVESG